MKHKRLIAGLLSVVTALSMTACAGNGSDAAEAAKTTDGTQTTETVAAAEAPVTVASPKYVFLFIGDGMSYPQFQAAADYLGAVADDDEDEALPSLKYDERTGVLDGPEALNFMNFEVAGSAVTYDSCSFAPDSASTATSIATGNKTYSGMINVDVTGTTEFETIAEKLHSQKGWKVGVILGADRLRPGSASSPPST